ncbi:MAG: hypothetical protein FIA92_13325 [Chloroflexi bacterium]|nr:hypothetical protein [Chloroflexota bacterium]
MAESNQAGEPLAVGRCPWCSHPLDDSSVATCPHCSAALHAQVEGDLPGVTQVDAMALATQRRVRGGGVRALIGLTDEDTEGSPALSVPEPPSEDVRREMLRLRIDALEAEIEAQNAALAAARAAAAAAGDAPVEPAAATEPAPAATGSDDEAPAPDASA